MNPSVQENGNKKSHISMQRGYQGIYLNLPPTLMKNSLFIDFPRLVKKEPNMGIPNL